MGFLKVLKSFRGPRLYRLYKTESQQGKDYTPNILESVGDTVVKWMRFFWSASCWTSPLLLPFLYRRGWFEVEGLLAAVSYGATLSIVLIAAIIIRGIGRVTNSDYQKFLGILLEAQRTYNATTKRALEAYDSEFWAWPVDFRWDQTSGDKTKKVDYTSKEAQGAEIQGLTWKVLSYLSAHTFGIRMMYPGKTSLIGALVGPALRMGRAKLVEERRNATRAKLLTRRGDEIDSMFIDRRNQISYQEHGNSLVVCCEGNSAFYEIGCTATPLDAGYSVLGWNHPGFGGSTGCPLPSSEQAAIDCVMQYAIYKLGFPVENIVLYAWSIGGYTASWAAMTYPDVKHVVLDATFDHVLPLAASRLSESFKYLVDVCIQKYINLNNAEQLVKYPGPVLLIRRTKDEMITTGGPGVLSTNRANDLLITLLKHRYPSLIDTSTVPRLLEYLAIPNKLAQGSFLTMAGVDDGYCESLLSSYAEQHSCHFPMQIEASSLDEKQQLTLFLASRHMRDFDSTHCVPLPADFFRTPWSPAASFQS